jgi:site-specific recombinase XerD
MVTNILNRGCLHTSTSMTTLQAYEARLIGEGKSKKTRELYMMVARRFEEFRKDAPLSMDLLLSFRDQEAVRIQGNSTIPYICGLNSFTEFLGRPELKVKPPRWKKKTVLPLTREEVQRIIRVAGENPDPIMAARNLAMLCVFADGAARLGEVQDLKISDLDFANGKAWARETKSGADRPIYISEATIQAVQAYLRVRPRPTDKASEDVLFISEKGGRMSSTAVRGMVQRCAALAGIQRRVWPHLLRHSRLTQLGEDGANAYEIKEVAGHQTLEMGVKYVHLSEQSVRKSLLSRPMIIVEGPKVSSCPAMDSDKAKVELALRLASGEIDAETFKMAIGALMTSPLEALR